MTGKSYIGKGRDMLTLVNRSGDKVVVYDSEKDKNLILSNSVYEELSGIVNVSGDEHSAPGSDVPTGEQETGENGLWRPRKTGGRLLVVVDMQNDFVGGALKNEMGKAIIPKVTEKIREARENGARIVFTKDTHTNNYMDTEEGKNLPVPHCILDTEGWELVDEVKALTANSDMILKKETFGSKGLGAFLEETAASEVELIGLCTDICVISNALLAKAFLPNAHVKVDAACCAGVTAESHDTALAAMKACHVEVVNQGKEPWR